MNRRADGVGAEPVEPGRWELLGTEAAVRLAIGTTYRSLGRYAEAEAQQRTALDLRQTVLGPDHADTVEAVHELAIVLREEGKLLEAEKLSRQALEGFTGSRGAEHPDTLSALDVLGVVLMQEQKLDEASSCIEKCLEDTLFVLGLLEVSRRQVLRPPMLEKQEHQTARSSGRSVISFKRFPLTMMSNISLESAAASSSRVSLSSDKAK